MTEETNIPAAQIKDKADKANPNLEALIDAKEEPAKQSNIPSQMPEHPLVECLTHLSRMPSYMPTSLIAGMKGSGAKVEYGYDDVDITFRDIYGKIGEEIVKIPYITRRGKAKTIVSLLEDGSVRITDALYSDPLEDSVEFLLNKEGDDYIFYQERYRGNRQEIGDMLKGIEKTLEDGVSIANRYNSSAAPAINKVYQAFSDAIKNLKIKVYLKPINGNTSSTDVPAASEPIVSGYTMPESA